VDLMDWNGLRRLMMNCSRDQSCRSTVAAFGTRVVTTGK
jgi:hypothetical protein